MSTKHCAAKKWKYTSNDKYISTDQDTISCHDTIEDQVQNLFNKRFTIVDDEQYNLPPPNSLFKSDSWEIQELQNLKHELNNVKNQLNNYKLNKWNAHTSSRNSAADVMKIVKRDIQPEFGTQAWLKFSEIVSSYPLVPIDIISSTDTCFKSIHLCEAPGAFVVSLNHWLQSNIPGVKWNWLATTLNPYYEGTTTSVMIADDRFIRHTLDHWCFGEDNTGDIMNLKNLDKLVEQSKPHNEILLVTADGSINCLDVPGEQENMVAHLHFCETVAALHLLAPGGSFVLKIFTAFECNTICLIYLLSCCFEKVNFFKPATSKEGNSETYVVCTEFKDFPNKSAYLEILRQYYECGPTTAMFKQNDIPQSFLKKMIECCRFFKNQQCLVITQNIDSFETNQRKRMLADIKRIQKMVSEVYITKYKLRKIESGEIVGKVVLYSTFCGNKWRDAPENSYNDRCKNNYMSPEDKLRQLYDEISDWETDASSDFSTIFTSCNVPETLQIQVAKAFDKVCSSRFCSPQVFRLQQDVENIIAKLKHEIDFPSMGEITHFRKTMEAESTYHVVVFKYTDHYDSHKTAKLIYDTLSDLNGGDTLAIIGFSLLTHYNIGLLQLLRSSFELMELTLHSTLGCIIALKYYNSNVKVMKHLIDIQITSSRVEEGKAVYQILPVSFLYDCDLYPTIVNTNDWIIKTFILHVISTLEEEPCDN